jgi:carboxypeptidase Q
MLTFPGGPKTGAALLVLAALAAVAASGACPAGSSPADLEAYRTAVEKMQADGLRGERAYEFLETLTRGGPRLTGSRSAAEAVALTRRMMDELGFENVHVEPITVGRWERGEGESAAIVGSSPDEVRPLSICALGGSVSTPQEGLEASVVEVRSFEELARLGGSARGNIIFYNRPMDRSLVDGFAAYGGAADQRVRGASEAAKLGAVAVLIRSLTFRRDAFPHTGLMSYDPAVAKIPAAAIATRDADTLGDLLRREPGIRVRLKLTCRTMPDVPSANVVGQLTGTEKPGEIILVGGHLDSWDLGTGAHDDGAGCVAAIEALRLIRDAGLRPARTIRAVMFMDEENGGTGGRFYARDERRKNERHLVAMESDRGGFVPVAFAAGGNGGAAVFEKLRGWAPLLRPLGIREFVRGGGGVDVAPLAEGGTVFASVIPDAQRYFDVHHSALDVLESVHPRELELNAIALAVFAYVLAQEGI